MISLPSSSVNVSPSPPAKGSPSPPAKGSPSPVNAEPLSGIYIYRLVKSLLKHVAIQSNSGIITLPEPKMNYIILKGVEMPNNNQAAIVSLNELPEYKYVNEDKEYDQSIHSVTLVKSSSTDSISSMYSAAAGKGDYDITGKVELGVWYSNGQLFVHVMKAKGLKQGRLSNPYVKIYLLPDHGKQSKRRTGIQQKTSNPIFDEVLKVMASLHINGNIKMSFVLFFLNHC